MASRKKFGSHATPQRRNEKLKKQIIDYGHVEIGDIATKASVDDIRRLKSILDRHCIYHIVDGVTFFNPHAKATPLKENHQDRVGKVDPTADRSRRRKNHHNDNFKFRKLIVPDLYKLDYMSLIFFDSEEADFLVTIVYDSH